MFGPTKAMNQVAISPKKLNVEQTNLYGGTLWESRVIKGLNIILATKKEIYKKAARSTLKGSLLGQKDHIINTSHALQPVLLQNISL